MKKMCLLFLMFLLQKIFLCFTWTLVPILLRSRGTSLGAIGMATLIYSPWAMKFLYASWIDRYYCMAMGRRKTWIVPLLILFAAVQWTLSMIDPISSLSWLLAGIFILNLISATMDIAMDGYATDILLPEERPWGNTIQTLGYMVGYMLGGGVFLICYHHQGWQATVKIMAILQIGLMLPVLWHREIPPVFPAGHKTILPQNHNPSVRAFIARADVLWFILFSLITILIDQGAAQLRLPMLVDKGWDPAGLGRIMLWYGSFASVLGAVAGAAIFRRAGVERLFLSICLGAGILCFYSAFIFKTATLSTVLIGILVGGEKFISGSMAVMLFSMVMALSAGPQSATNNAVLNSLIHMFMLGMAPITGALCDMTGFFPLYLGLGLASPVLYMAGTVLLRHCNNPNVERPKQQINPLPSRQKA